MYYTIAGIRIELPDTLIRGHFAEALRPFATASSGMEGLTRARGTATYSRPGTTELIPTSETPTDPRSGAAELKPTTKTPTHPRTGAASLTSVSEEADLRLRSGAVIPALSDYRKLHRFDFADAGAECRFGRDAAGWLLEMTPRNGSAPARFRMASGSESDSACFHSTSSPASGSTSFHSISGPASGSEPSPASGSESGSESGPACFRLASGSASGSACFHSASGPAQALTDITPAHNPALLRFGLWTLFNLAALHRGAVALHASAIRFRERGVLFLGESGTGKSTHTRLWREHISGTVLLNDDSPVIRAADDEARVYGSPWSGKTPCYRNENCPIAAVVRLSQAPHNRIRRLRPIEAIGALLPSAPPAFVRDDELSDALCSVLSRVIAQVPVYRLECRPDADAARLTCRTIFNDTTL